MLSYLFVRLSQWSWMHMVLFNPTCLVGGHIIVISSSHVFIVVSIVFISPLLAEASSPPIAIVQRMHL